MIRATLMFLALLAFGYLCGAFIAADLNSAHWDTPLRVCVLMLTLSVAPAGAMIAKSGL